MWQIQCIAALALGNGTRPRGFVFGTIAEEDQVVAALEAAQMADLPVVRELVDRSADVLDEELLSALRTAAQGGPVQIVDPETQGGEVNTDAAEAFKATAIDDLKIAKKLKEALAAVGLQTIGELIEYAEEHKGLTSIDGIDAGAEEKIVAALKLL